MPTLVVCAAPALAEGLRSTPLWRGNIDRHVTGSAEETRKLVAQFRPNLIVIDRDLPAAEALVREFRASQRCSIAVIAPGEVQASEVVLLECGANAILRFPPGPDWEDRLARLIEVPTRKQVRIHVDLEVEGLFGTEQVRGRVANISRTGMLLECPTQARIGDEMKFQLHLSQSTILNGTARVVRFAGTNLYGCEFGGMDSYDLRRLEFFLQQP